MSEDATGAERPPHKRPRGRRRRANVEGGRQYRHTVKVTPEEEAQLLRLANEQSVTVPRLLVEAALASESSMTATEGKMLAAELFGMHRKLSGIAVNVNQIAKATNATGEVQRTMEAALAATGRVCRAIEATLEEVSAR